MSYHSVLKGKMASKVFALIETTKLDCTSIRLVSILHLKTQPSILNPTTLCRGEVSGRKGKSGKRENGESRVGRWMIWSLNDGRLVLNDAFGM